MAKDSDTLTDLKQLFEETADMESDQRTTMLDDLRFGRLGQQWPDQIAKQRQSDGRPMLTINLMPTFIRQVVNDARQNRPQIKVKPVGEQGNVKTAAVYNGLIKHIEAVSKADIAYDTAMDFAVSCGLGYFRIDIDYEHPLSFDKVLRINRVQNVFSVYGDPYSKCADSSDWNYAFLVDYLSKDQFKKDYKGADDVNWQESGYTTLVDPWVDDDAIMIAEAWQRSKTKVSLLKLSNGEVMEAPNYEKIREFIYDPIGVIVEADRDAESYKITHRIMSGAEVLETNEWAGKYIPVVPVYGEETNVEGKRLFKSLINNAKDAQRMMNYWRTTSTELVSLAPRVPFIGEEGAFDVEGEARKWANANRESYPYLQYKRGFQPPQRQPLDGGSAIGAMAEAMSADRDIKNTIGMHEASLGQRSNETSGKAISLRQREGDTSTFHFIDNLNRAICHAGTILVDLIPKVYTGERVIRIIQPDGTDRAVKLGSGGQEAPYPVPTPGGMPMQAGLGLPPMPMPPAGMGGGQGMPLPGPPPTSPMPQGMGGPPMGMSPQLPMGGPTPLDPQLEAIGDVFDLGAGIYDVVVDTGKSYTTQREEFAVQAMEFARSFPQAVPLIGDILVKALDWPQAEEIAQRLKSAQGGGVPPEVKKQMAEAMQKMQQLEQENAALKANVQGKQVENQIKAQEMQIDARQGAMEAEIKQREIEIKQKELEIKAFEAETDRMRLSIEQYQAEHPPQPARTN